MSAKCNHVHEHISPRFRRALWIALIINALMFFIEVGAGLQAASVSLLADALDFAGDAANYAISLFVLTLGISWRSRAALFKGATMIVFGIYILGQAIWNISQGYPPDAITMGAIAILALLANVIVATMLYAYREGDANMRSVWLCSRNDAIGNIAVLFAAAGVFGTASIWPDITVAAIMSALAISSGTSIVKHACHELKHHQPH